MSKSIIKEIKDKAKAEKKAQRKAKVKKFVSVAKHYVIAGLIVAVVFGLYQFRAWSYEQGYEAGRKDGEQSASETDQVVITRVKEIKELLNSLK